MKKLLLILTSLLILAVNVYGTASSYTTVTATLVDSSSQVWSYATVVASLRPSPNNPGLPLNNGNSITDNPQTIICDSNGTFTLTLDSTNSIAPAGALWTFTIYPNASVAVGNSINIAVTGTTANFSVVLSNILTVPSVNASPLINRAYSDSEVIGGTGDIYWDTTLNVLKGCFTLVNNICTWSTINNVTIINQSPVIYSTPSVVTNVSIPPVTIVTATTTLHTYRFSAFLNQTSNATCSIYPTVSVTISTAIARGSTFHTISSILPLVLSDGTSATTLTLSSGNILVTDEYSSGIYTFNGQTASTTSPITYSTTYSGGTCTTYPNYQVFPILEQLT